MLTRRDEGEPDEGEPDEGGVERELELGLVLELDRPVCDACPAKGDGPFAGVPVAELDLFR